jgi:hypothetical protein
MMNTFSVPYGKNNRVARIFNPTIVKNDGEIYFDYFVVEEPNNLVIDVDQDEYNEIKVAVTQYLANSM